MNKELEKTQKAITIGILVIGIIYIIIVIATFIYNNINNKAYDWDVIIALTVCGFGAFAYALIGLISKKELRRRTIKANDERKRAMQLKIFKTSYGFASAILFLMALSTVRSSDLELSIMGASLLLAITLMWLVYFSIYFIVWIHHRLTIRNKEEKG